MFNLKFFTVLASLGLLLSSCSIKMGISPGGGTISPEKDENVTVIEKVKLGNEMTEFRKISDGNYLLAGEDSENDELWVIKSYQTGKGLKNISRIEKNENEYIMESYVYGGRFFIISSYYEDDSDQQIINLRNVDPGSGKAIEKNTLLKVDDEDRNGNQNTLVMHEFSGDKSYMVFYFFSHDDDYIRNTSFHVYGIDGKKKYDVQYDGEDQGGEGELHIRQVFLTNDSDLFAEIIEVEEDDTYKAILKNLTPGKEANIKIDLPDDLTDGDTYAMNNGSFKKLSNGNYLYAMNINEGDITEKDDDELVALYIAELKPGLAGVARDKMIRIGEDHYIDGEVIEANIIVDIIPAGKSGAVICMEKAGGDYIPTADGGYNGYKFELEDMHFIAFDNDLNYKWNSMYSNRDYLGIFGRRTGIWLGFKYESYIPVIYWPFSKYLPINYDRYSHFFPRFSNDGNELTVIMRNMEPEDGLYEFTLNLENGKLSEPEIIFEMAALSEVSFENLYNEDKGLLFLTGNSDEEENIYYITPAYVSKFMK